jgi:glutamate formiminotransferase
VAAASYLSRRGVARCDVGARSSGKARSLRAAKLESTDRLNGPWIECVPNLSEGRDASRVHAFERALSSAPGTFLLDRTSDADHNRTVITFVAHPETVVEAAVRLTAKAVELIDLNHHHGVHPRLGALDVLPFVPLGSATLDQCVALAHHAGARIWNEIGVPVYFYEAAALRADRVRLENVRRAQFEGLRTAVMGDESKRPDLGGPSLHLTAGAVIVGARKILIAYNVNLKSTNLDLAKSIARRIRASNGGFPSVKALGVPLVSRGLVQVAMNFTDFEQTPVHVVYSEVCRLAAEHGVEVEESELIGLMPRKALELAAASALKISQFDSRRTIENRIETVISAQAISQENLLR